ncbi:MAG: hypothetical protein KF729_24390 [Sandaracinaceae bacterium]|nr:hypothetical protein [Sandaracinaceae bacterium]
MARATALWVTLALIGCASPPSTSLYAHPFPDERMRGDDGTIEADRFPWGTGAPLRAASVAALRGTDGFGTTAAILFPFEAPLDPSSLPSLEESVAPGASVALIDVDPSSPERGRHLPLDVRFLADAGPFGGTNLLVALPLPGVALAPETRYAAVVTTRARTLGGALAPTDERGETAAHEAARAELARLGIDGGSIAALAVLRTADPTRELRRALEQARGDARALSEAPRLVEEHDAYCVYASELAVPVYQHGTPPYLTSGGAWARDADGALVLARYERARVWITVPRRADPSPPLAVFVRAGGGGDRPLVDRGPGATPGAWAAGRGPAVELAEAGWVGVSVDGPLGGARNLAGWDEQLAVFNALNLPALRDTVRQSALELALLPHALADTILDTRGCAGAAPATALASDDLALVAHSTGATIAPLAAAVEPRYRALVLSGAGASWLRQIVHKRSPVPMRPLAEHLLGYTGRGVTLREHDPILSLLSWAGEVADPIAYARALDPSVHVLVFQGVRDTYIPPPIANPMALAFGLELAGDALDAESERPVLGDLALVGRGARALPASPSSGQALRVVVQHPEDGVEDGHEALFQQPAARRQLRCFLETLRGGAPVLVDPVPLDPVLRDGGASSPECSP